ncbi:hypothetical protein Lalb_Chr04g0262151 [Lupinus albus]|uniref:Uncharacterized protein n=1 Tax=Lupinus albus TaxID=3870 RepID=A0A6A4QRB1_LUPAL|nr:hypothetical protein Lalb_Chr04g0262151 [Lupinus albus]
MVNAPRKILKLKKYLHVIKCFKFTVVVIYVVFLGVKKPFVYKYNPQSLDPQQI